MEKFYVALAMVGLVGCAGHSSHSEVRDANDVVLSQVDYQKTGNGSTAYSSVTKLGAGTYPGMVPGLVGGYAPTGQTPMMILQMPSESEGMNAMEQHGAAPGVILQQQVPVNGAVASDDMGAIIEQFDDHESRIRALETKKKGNGVNPSPKKKGEPRE